MKSPSECLIKAAELYSDRGLKYGDNWLKVGQVLNILFSNQIATELCDRWTWDRIHLVTMILVKLTRFTNGMLTGNHHKDSTRDLVVYAAMLDSLSEDKE